MADPTPVPPTRYGPKGAQIYTFMVDSVGNKFTVDGKRYLGKYSPSDDQVVATPSMPLPGLPAGGGVGGIGNPLDFLKLLSSPNLWIRVGEFGVGAILIAVGVSALMRPISQPVVRTARKTASFAATKGVVK